MPDGATESDAASHAAATKVQAIMRGSSARKKSATKRAESAGEAVREVSMPGHNQADSDAVFDAAATKVQAVLRGTGARKRSKAGSDDRPSQSDEQPGSKFGILRKKKSSFVDVVMQAKTVYRAKRKFNDLSRPRRPPFPGTATPPGYVINKSRTRPADASNWERGRDYSLYLGTHWMIAIVQLVWLLSLVGVFLVFVGCMLYLFDWGEKTDDDWGCPTWPGVGGNSTCCTCADGALTYKVEDYWNEKMTQGLSALFTYSVLLATPWRLSILGQCVNLHSRIPRDENGKLCSGVDFYGKPNEMPFFHIPWGARLAIALLLNLNTTMQLIHQVLHFVWNDVVIAFEQPYSMISLLTGPLAGCFTGAPAAIIQIYWDNKLHAREPKRFPPGIAQAIRHLYDKKPEGSVGSSGSLGASRSSKGSQKLEEKPTAGATAPRAVAVQLP